MTHSRPRHDGCTARPHGDVPTQQTGHGARPGSASVQPGSLDPAGPLLPGAWPPPSAPSHGRHLDPASAPAPSQIHSGHRWRVAGTWTGFLDTWATLPAVCRSCVCGQGPARPQDAALTLTLRRAKDPPRLIDGRNAQAHGMLFPRPGIEPSPSAASALSAHHWGSRQPRVTFLGSCAKWVSE